jgi:hypothetical protein
MTQKVKENFKLKGLNHSVFALLLLNTRVDSTLCGEGLLLLSALSGESEFEFGTEPSAEFGIEQSCLVQVPKLDTLIGGT